MAKPEWGKKRLCPSCGTKFYDLRKSPPACPSCGETVDVEAPTKSRRSRGKDSGRAKAASAAPAAPAASAEEPVLGDETDETPLDDDTSEEIDDSSELGEDEPLGNVVDDDEQENN
ncbi:TIGR02300 family protein [Rhodovibrio sodomensis]|uniref:TIGR02300 family protein n=1 Tax=Rhodovibrio sodomensis TaxID=1088 RepID=A0ABS1DNA7_9PROT|nr:TIGR02300 family protein [Rhodovibrio sodomensis]